MHKKIKILHLEDSLSDAELVKRILRKGKLEYDILLVDNKAGFLDALANFCPDVILSDHSLPSFNSHIALDIIRKAGIKTPFILITANVSEEFAVDVLNRGADDYILKDRLERLPIAINNTLVKYSLENQRERFLAELTTKEKRYHTLIENGADAVAILSAEGKPNYVSSSIERILGYTEEETMELSLFGVLHPDDVEQISIAFSECLSKPGVPIAACPSRVKHKNGEWVWLECTLTNMLHDPDINGIVDNFRDVTERKLAEQLINDNEQKYRSFFDNSMDGILLTEKNGNVLKANQAACDIFQMTEEEIIMAGRTGLVDMTDSRLKELLVERELTGKTKGELTFLRKDGSKFPGEISSAIFKDAAGNERTSMIIRDISERKLASDKIENANRLYNFIGQINHAIVHIKDEKTLLNEACKIAVDGGKFKMAWIGISDRIKRRIRLVASHGANKEEKKIFSDYGYDPDGAIEKTINGAEYWVVTINDQALQPAWIKIAQKSGFNSAIVLPIKRSGKVVGTFNIFSTEADFFNPEEIGLLIKATENLSFALDVLEKEKRRAMAEKALRYSEAKLLEKEAYLQAYTKELVISNTELEQFSYIISHNLRAPVANIMGLAEQLKDDSHSMEVKDILNEALSDSIKILDTVTIDLNTILKVKREITEQKELVNLSELICNIQADFQKQAHDEGFFIDISLLKANELLTIKSYLYSIVYNLISNSIKYRQPGIKPHIVIASENNKKQFSLKFRDNGMGIDLVKRKDQVFGLYKRFHNHVDGKGMGLFMVKTQVETLGGKITIDSEVNRGTKFTILFPY